MIWTDTSHRLTGPRPEIKTTDGLGAIPHGAAWWRALSRHQPVSESPSKGKPRGFLGLSTRSTILLIAFSAAACGFLAALVFLN